MKNNGFTSLFKAASQLPVILPAAYGEVIEYAVLGVVEGALAVQ